MKIMLISILGALAILVGCAATPPAREVQLPPQSIDESSQEGLVQLVIFNDSNSLLYGLDGSGKINIHQNGKGVGQLKIGQYVVLTVKEGSHIIGLLHKDLVNFSSTHTVSVSGSPTYLKIYAKVTSNGAEIVSRPEGFESKFKPAY